MRGLSDGERFGGLSPEEDRARLEGANERRAKMRAMFPSPPVADDDPFRTEKLAARAAHAKLNTVRAEQWDLPAELDRLLSGENPDDGETLARVKAIRKRLAALPAELEAASDAVRLADARLAPARAAEHQAYLDQAGANFVPWTRSANDWSGNTRSVWRRRQHSNAS